MNLVDIFYSPSIHEGQQDFANISKTPKFDVKISEDLPNFYTPNTKIIDKEIIIRENRYEVISRGIFDDNFETKMPNLIIRLKGYVSKEEQLKINTYQIVIEHYRELLAQNEAYDDRIGMVSHYIVERSISDCKNDEFLKTPSKFVIK